MAELNTQLLTAGHDMDALVAPLTIAASHGGEQYVRINGQDYQPSTPDALVAKIKEIVGNVPGLDGAAPPAQAPAPPQ